MTSSTLTILESTIAAVRGYEFLRFNPNHAPSGEHGGEFTSGGGGGSAGKPHGKHWAKRQRRRKAALAKIRAKAHAKAEKVKEGHKAERKALREKHQSDGSKLSDRRKERKALATKQRTERRETTRHLRGEIRKEAEAKGVAKPRASKSDKAKEFADKRERVHAVVKEIGQESLAKNAVRHREERKETITELKGQRSELRDKLKEERQELRDALVQDYKDDRQISIDNAGNGRKAKLEAIKQNQEYYKGHIKESMGELRQEHRDQLEDHREHARMVLDKMALAHHKENLVSKRLEHESRREIIQKLKGKLDEKYPSRGGDHGQRSWNPATADQIRENRRSQHSGLKGDVLSRSGDARRFGRTKLHKASSAESILAHALRQRGWSARWRDGGLTDRQRVRLLEDIRQYGRQWLRHEAETFFERYGDAEVARRGLGASDSEGATGSSGLFGRAQPDDGQTDTESRAVHVSRSLSDRLLSPLKRWFDRNRGFVQELMYAAAQSQEGTHHLSAQTAQFVDELVQVQRDYLDQFYLDLQTRTPAEIADILGPPLPGIVPSITINQAIARAEQYGNAAWQGGQKVLRRRKKESGGARFERRIMGHPRTEHCHDCPPLAHLGWQPVGTLPDIGDTECGGYCLCHFEYSDAVEMPEMKPKKPKPEKPKGYKIREPHQLDALMEDLREKLAKAGVGGLKINVAVQVGVGKK